MSEWTPVSERLPTEHKWYRVYIQTDNQAFQRDLIWLPTEGWLDAGRVGNWPVTHWMPLPDPPGESA